ncbi:hypothetical protein [Thermochromatium tepidum]|uniref:Uncharacterized protein n=1 Tax=Thermochromatium tepidum ATCC 43061 TaxID=316276 RepID=A0A6I6E8I5_THETI|nr:hypothetical protein [Thermochromatium tepidum]QGU32868.1 hypothetical protein E6P07_07660 [Thermochromatium tepidum ATCC 43061]
MSDHDECLQRQIVGQGHQEHERRPSGVLNARTLRRENRLYANTLGVSQNNAGLGFRPGYLNRRSGEYVLSRFSDGTPAPIHVLDGLPDSWVRARDAAGHVLEVAPEVVSGFVRGNRFYTREEAAWAVNVQHPRRCAVPSAACCC